jgi:toxin CptA
LIAGKRAVQFPITIGLHRSRILGWVFFALTGIIFLVAVNFLRSTPEIGVIFLLLLLLAMNGWRKLSPAVSALHLESDGNLAARPCGKTEFIPVRIRPNATVHPWLTVFQVDTEEGRNLTVIATIDSMQSDDFRRLRVFLRWRADFSANDDA